MESPPKRQVILMSNGKKKTFKPLLSSIEPKEIVPQDHDTRSMEPAQDNQQVNPQQPDYEVEYQLQFNDQSHTIFGHSRHQVSSLTQEVRDQNGSSG